MGDTQLDYEGVFRFQHFLHRRYGMPLNGDRQEKKETPEKILPFFRDLVSRDLSSHVCVDLGDIAAANFCSVEEKDGGLVVFISGEDDFEIGNIRLVPERMEVVMDPDPRKSYAAVFRTPKQCIEEVHGAQAFSIDKRMNCVLFYPHNSLLMEKAYKEKVLVDLGVQFSPQEYKLVPYDARTNWHHTILDHVVDKVVGGLARHYLHAKIQGVDVSDGVPVRGSDERLLSETNHPTVSFDIQRSHGMKKARVERTVQLLLEKHVPFPAEIFSQAVPKRLTKVSILFDFPELC